MAPEAREPDDGALRASADGDAVPRERRIEEARSEGARAEIPLAERPRAERLERARAALGAALSAHGVPGFGQTGFGEAPQAGYAAAPGPVERPLDRPVEPSVPPPAPAARARRRPPALLGAPGLDAALGGGLARAAIHEVMARDAGDLGAAHGFALALAARLAARPASGPRGESGGRTGRVLVVQDEEAVREDGDLYGPGLALHGLDPARLVLVRAETTREALWATEQALRCPALAAVIAEISRVAGIYDLTASRRLTLAAREGATTGLVVRAGFGAHGTVLASAAATRWIVAAAPSRPGLAGEPGLPAWSIALTRHRGGHEGSFHLEWNHDDRAFRELDPAFAAETGARAEALSRPRPADARHRSGADGAPRLLPFARSGSRRSA